MYTVKGLFKTGKGTVETTLTKFYCFAIATNQALTSRCPVDLANRLDYITRHYKSGGAIQLDGSGAPLTHLYIQGPRGGVYNYKTGKLAR